MTATAGIRYLELGVADLDRSGTFYGDLLGLPEVAGPEVVGPDSHDSELTRWFDGGTALIKLVAVVDGSAGEWRDDDLQGGIRHAGFKTAEIDAFVARLEAAGTRIVAPPRDVLGDVRIAFFLDPDGARLELVQGALAYQRIESAHLVHQEATDLPHRAAPPRFDHVGLTVDDLAKTAGHLTAAGYELIGDIRHHDDPRGFLMTYFGAGGSVLEVFSFDVPTSPPPTWENRRLGLRGIGVAPVHELLEAQRPHGVQVVVA